MKLMTWNLSGGEFSEDRVENLFATHDLHVLCLQSVRAQSREVLERCARRHHLSLELAEAGGSDLAILSVLPLKESRHPPLKHAPSGSGLMAVSVGDLRLYCAHFPLGTDHGDVVLQAKVALLEEVTRFLREHHGEEDSFVLAGSLAVAPLPDDVWSIEHMKNRETYSGEEHRAWAQLLSVGLYDAAKPFLPFGTFTCWEKNVDNELSRVGRRLDHILVSSPIRDRAEDASIVRGADDSSARRHDPVLLSLGTG